MSTAYWLTGDVREVLASMPDGCVDLILTSPPFLALRSYLPADHPDKAKEIGSEATPANFLDTLLDLTVEWRRVLAPHGSLCVELGDTYSGSGGAGGDYGEGGMRDGQPKFRAGYVRNDRPNRPPQEAPKSAKFGSNTRRGRVVDHDSGRRTPASGWPLDKSLCGIPELYRLSLAYGRNMLRPDHTLEPWRVRNVIRWCRPNPPVGALGDKFRPATSEMVVACTSRERWFDLDAVRTPVQHPDQRATRNGKSATDNPEVSGRGLKDYDASMSAGAPPLDWWQVSTEPYAGSHYAAWPRALLTRPIQAMCPLRVCVTCGQPSRRIVDVQGLGGRDFFVAATGENNRDLGLHGRRTPMPNITRETTGWTDCGHNAWRTGIVLDPFAGSGTTLAVATGHGRDAIGIDLDDRNLHLARERVGMWLTEGPPPEWAAAEGAA